LCIPDDSAGPNGAGRLFLAAHAPTRHFERSRPTFSSAFAPANVSACGCEKSLFSSGTAVGINLSPEVVDYFKGLADETGLPYQKLIDLYPLDCAKKRKKLTMKWVA
jgi:hypothetical protein